MAWSVEIDGVAVNVQRDSLNIVDNIDWRSTATFTVETETSVEFERGETVEILDDATTVFAGQVLSTTSYVTPNDSLRYHTVTAADWHSLADRRIVAASYQSETAGDIVRDLISEILTDEGIAEDVGNSSISDGPTLEEAVFNYIPVSQALNALAEYAGFHWWIDVDKKLWFKERSAVTAPWSLTWDDIDTGNVPTITGGNTTYRNTQYMKGGTAQTESQIETFVGDGERTTFTVGYPVATAPTIELNSVAQTVGIRELDSGKDWYWQKGSNQITQDSGGTTLTGSDTLEVTYVGQFSIVAKLQNVNEVDRLATLEGTSGKYEAVEDAPETSTQDSAFQKGGALLERYAVEGKTLQFFTTRSGLKPGQLLTVTLEELGLDGDELLISNITTTDIDGTIIVYGVSAVIGPYDSWVKLFDFLLNRGQSFVLRENIDEQANLALLHQPSEAWGWGESVSQTVHSCPVPNTTLYPSTTLYPC